MGEVVVDLEEPHRDAGGHRYNEASSDASGKCVGPVTGGGRPATRVFGS